MSFHTWDYQKLNKSIENYELGIKDDDLNRNIKEGGVLLELNPSDLQFFNPNTKSPPIFKRKKDFDLIKKVYRKASIIIPP